MISLAEKNDKIHLSANQFIKALQGEKQVVDKQGNKHNFFYTRYKLGNTNHNNAVVIDSRVVVSEPILIEENELLGDELVFPEPILILGGTFQSWFRIDGGDFQNSFRIDGGDFQNSFRIEGGTFQDEFHIDGGTFQDLFHIDGGTFQDLFHIYGATFQDEFHVYGATFQKWFRVYGGTFQGGFSIYKSVFQDWFSIEGGVFQDGFNINRSDFQDEFHIYGGTFLDRFRIYEGTFQDWFRIERGTFQDWFSIYGGTFQNSFRIEGGTFQNSFRIEGGTFQNSLCIEGGEFNQEFTLDNASNQSIIYHFQIMTPISSKFVIKKNAQLHQLTIKEGVTSNGMLYIESVHLHRLTFTNFINEGKLEVTGVRMGAFDLRKVKQSLSPKIDIKRMLPLQWITLKGKSQIVLSESNLGNAVFKTVAFKDFDQIVIKDTKVNNISVLNEHFPLKAKKLGNQVDDRKGKLKHEPPKMAEIYNQLYLAMQKQGFKSQEMKYYATYLKWELQSAWKAKKLGKVFPLFLSKISTNFGQSWLLGVCWFFVLGFLCYWGYIENINWKGVKLEYTFKQNFGVQVQYYFQFLNPIRKGHLITDAKLNWMLVCIDFTWRIIFGYLTYQIVAAFRRFGRK
ncbi:hypothetical protein BKI52_02605 [marine bacterium AO1-C]|nr:hypothetical protein BKI52_02605 [marine bacterium AO1-C]